MPEIIIACFWVIVLGIHHRDTEDAENSNK